MAENGAFNYGIWLLSKRDYSEKLIEEKILKKEYSQKEATDAIARLKDCGFLNDISYARRYINQALEVKKHGFVRIKNDLMRKGVAREVVEDILYEFENADEKETLMPLVRKKLNGDFDIKNVNKVKRYFFTRGYKPSDISECIRMVRIEEDEKDVEIEL